MQLANAAKNAAKAARFSIHKRIEGGATTVKTRKPIFVDEFQYPQADRRGCNDVPLSLVTPLIKGFSIHKRIEGGATIFEKPAVLKLNGFQYPQADRRGCNVNRLALLKKNKKVSVSTSGSKGVQPPSMEMDFLHQCEFQYPQADRRGCNEFFIPVHDIRITRFSIHKRIEGGATELKMNVTLEILIGFSIHKRIEGGATLYYTQAVA